MNKCRERGNLRKILIISGKSGIFKYLALELRNGIQGDLKVFLASEESYNSVLRLILKRIKTFGFLMGINQIIMRFIDIRFLRFRVEKNLKYQFDKLDIRIDSINSEVFRKFTLENRIDIVVCIGTSLVSQNTLSTANIGFINIHPGYLPHYRGLGNFWAVINKDWEHIGVTCHWIDSGIDTGEIIWKEKITQLSNSYWGINLDCFNTGINFLKENLKVLEPGKNQPEKRNYRLYPWFGISYYIKFKVHLRKRRIENSFF